MILMVFLFDPTVPSEPRPKKIARTTSSFSMSIVASYASERRVTSSSMPMVNPLRGFGFASSS